MVIKNLLSNNHCFPPRDLCKVQNTVAIMNPAVGRHVLGNAKVNFHTPIACNGMYKPSAYMVKYKNGTDIMGTVDLHLASPHFTKTVCTNLFACY